MRLVVACLFVFTLACSLVLTFCQSAFARVERFALIAGNNQGLPHETALRYAQSDARKVHDTLRDIGGFEPYNMVLVEGGNADTLRRSLIEVNDRLRTLRSRPNTQVMLFVYYSGHADAEDLHVGDTRLSVAELTKLVRGSAADFRLLLLDACRAGVVTRSKGGRMTQPFDIQQPPELSGEGLVFLAASAEDEVAQESDELGSSFFTHAFVSGLLGAADRDRDGNVVLDEAYQYAYEGTLRASSRSASGLQHPTFFYDLRGQGQLVLTRPFALHASRGLLDLPPAITFLVLRGGPDGGVIAETLADNPVRSLSLAPGTYFVRGRSAAHALEGTVVVVAQRTTRVEADRLDRVEYAQLVRKGGSDLRRAHAFELGGHAHTALPNSDTPCFGAAGGYRLDTPFISWMVRTAFCRSQLRGGLLQSNTHQFDLGVRAVHVWDLSARFALEAGLGLGGAYMVQTFVTRREAPARNTFAGMGELVAGASVDLTNGLYVQADVALQTYLLPLYDATSRKDSLRGAITGRLALGAGKRF